MAPPPPLAATQRGLGASSPPLLPAAAAGAQDCASSTDSNSDSSVGASKKRHKQLAVSLALVALLLLVCASVALQGCGARAGANGGGGGREAELVRLSDYPLARCLDGSPGAYYFRAAAADVDDRAWVISLEGGGECTTNSSCTERRDTDLGSSLRYPPRLASLPQFASEDPAENPDRAGWNHVRVKYCSGDLHLGQMNASEPPRWGWARFAGAQIVRAVLEDLTAARGLAHAERIVWTGESAGGIGSFAHLDAVADRFPHASVVGAPIAGYYWDDATPYTGYGQVRPRIPFGVDGFRELYTLYKMFVPERCASGPLSETPWACGLADFSFRTVVTPVFFVEAQIDWVQMVLHAGAHCNPKLQSYHAQVPYCLAWGHNMTSHLQQVADRANADPARAGLFSPACRIHREFSGQSPKVRSMSYGEAFSLWMRRAKDGEAVVLRDVCCDGSEIQFNPTCPGIGVHHVQHV